MVTFPSCSNPWAAASAPWITPRLRQRIRDFNTVLGCRFPTVSDVRAPTLAKRALSLMSAWRYRFERYDHPWELDLGRRLIALHDPKTASL